MELNIVVGGINAAAIKPNYQRDGGRDRGGRGGGRGGGGRGQGERRDRERGPRDGNAQQKEGQGEQKKEEQKVEEKPVDEKGESTTASGEVAQPKEGTADAIKKDAVKPAEKSAPAAEVAKPVENRPSLASLQKLKAPPKNNNNQQKKNNNSSAASEAKPAFEIEYDIVAVKDPSKPAAPVPTPAPGPAPNANPKNNNNPAENKNANANQNQKAQGKPQQQTESQPASQNDKKEAKPEGKVEAPASPQKGQNQGQKKQNQKKDAAEEKPAAEEGKTHKDDVFVDLPSPLSEKLVSGQQTLIEVNGALYLKLDPKKVDPAWLKTVQTAFEKNKVKEQVSGGFFLVEKPAKK